MKTPYSIEVLNKQRKYLLNEKSKVKDALKTTIKYKGSPAEKTHWIEERWKVQLRINDIDEAIRKLSLPK